MSLAEMESNNISEQTRNGTREKAKQGKLITTHAPFGIVIDKVILLYMKKKPIQSKQFIAGTYTV